MYFPTLFLVVFNDCQGLLFLGFICDKNCNHLLTHNLDVSFQNYALGDLYVSLWLQTDVSWQVVHI